ncbi:hypothetical protein [Lichenicoccus sp.]|uniref:hypothetical protein n=1 Tax=Lichenicoccus sp. TaxID=2781899 RepID=UPI003D0DE255
MARATTPKSPARKSRSMVIEPAPKRKPGRPAGSTNAKKPVAKVSATRASAPKVSAAKTPAPKVGVRASKMSGKRTPAAKLAASAPKMSKADLEAHVTKLERTVSRLREKNKELKQVASDAREHADTLEVELSARHAPEAAKPPRKQRRSASSQPEVSESEMTETELPES